MEKLENAIAEIKKVFPGMKILENEPMRAHCSFRTGGPVRALAYPSDLSSLTKLCCILKEHELAPLMLGNCTNIVFPDEGMSEVFAICTEKLTKLFLLPDGAIYAECGVPLSRLAAQNDADRAGGDADFLCDLFDRDHGLILPLS